MGSSDVMGSTEWTGVCRSTGGVVGVHGFMGFLKRLLGKKNCLGTLLIGWKHKRPDRSVPSFSLRGNGNAPQLSYSEAQSSKGIILLRLSTIMLNTGEKCGAGKAQSGIGDNSDQPR